MTNTKVPLVKIYAAFVVENGVIIDCDYNVDRSNAMESFEQDQHFYTTPQKQPKLAEGFFCEVRVRADWEHDQIGDYLNDLNVNDLRPLTMFSWDNRYHLGV